MSTTVAPASLAGVLGEEWRRPGGSALALADALRALVVDGRLAVRTRVPSERELAPELGVSRGTVSRAYDRLRADGFLVSARGAGSFLTLPGDTRAPSALPPAGGTPAHVTALSIAALPAPEPLMGQAAAAAALAMTRHASTHGYTGAGLPELREAIAARFTERGAPTTADEVMVTAGAQQALHLLLAVLTGPGDRVVVDAPAYARTLAAVRDARARAVPVPLTQTGWDPDAWRAALAAAAPPLALTIPDFHNPTGLTMADAHRAAIAEACAR